MTTGAQPDEAAHRGAVTSGMEWTFGPATKAYTAELGGGHARVWRAPAGTWSARVTIHRYEQWRHGFHALEEAQAWCEAQLNQLVAQDRGSQ
jgi:hypothetical protein